MSWEKRETVRRFTEDEMRIARETDMPDLLARLGYQVKRVGQYYTTAEMDSLRIKNRRTWFRYSTKQHGDAITFLQEFQGLNFPEAVHCLLAFHGHSRDSPEIKKQSSPVNAERKSEEKPEFTLPPACENQRRVYAYLRKRGISVQVIQSFISQNLLYEDSVRHNCVFVGKNAEGKPVFASRRGTYDKDGKSFKGDVAGSDKGIAFRLPCSAEIDWVTVFEAPIDLMSFCTLNKNIRSNAVALCGLYEGALDSYLKDNPHLRHIVLCLDADKPGQEATEHLKDKYEKAGYRITVRIPPKGKDWNEYLQHRTAEKNRAR